MNAFPALGLVITRANGEPLITKLGSDTQIAHIRLVKSVCIPSLKGCFFELEVDSNSYSDVVGRCLNLNLSC